MSEVTQKVIAIVSSHTGAEPSEITADSYLLDDLNADQLTIADIAGELEETFKLSIAQADLAGFQTVGDIITYISENLNEL